MKNNSALSGSLVCVFAACATLVAEVQTPAANEIMAKVAANQERSLEARKQWVYEQESVTRL
ncbi:MAG TPA: hypothetical protein VEQ63_02345, partial [Bryobacteraceae bacterium]|nr:hypothetical protein [Bryobacteraceae bacterium]